MKDLNSSDKNTIFSFITNDTDFLPLFREIKSKNELYWLRGSAKPSNQLKSLVIQENQIELSEFFEKYHFFSMANSFWNNQFIKVVVNNFDFEQASEIYYHKLLVEEYEVHREKELDELWKITMAEIDETIKPKDEND